MKTKCLQLLLALVAVLPASGLVSGCAALQRPITDAALGAGGGFLASELSHGNPAITAAGAVGGVALGEGINALKSRSEQKSFADGYHRGRADGVKSVYWNLVDQQRQPTNAR